MNTYIFINDTQQDIIDSVWADSFDEAQGYVGALPDDVPTRIETVYGKALDYTTVCQLYTQGAWR